MVDLCWLYKWLSNDLTIVISGSQHHLGGFAMVDKRVIACVLENHVVWVVDLGSASAGAAVGSSSANRSNRRVRGDGLSNLSGSRY